MELYRKYFSQEQLEELAVSEPNWGVTIQNHPDSYYFDWEKGRVIQEFQIVYISSGSGVFESETISPTMVEAGTAFLLFPNVWHRYKPSQETGWEEFWVGFGGHYSEYLMRQDCFKADNPLIRIGFNSELLNIFIRLVQTLKFEGIAFKQIASCLVIQLLGLVYASALMTDQARSHREKLVHRMRYQIHESIATNLDMEKLAKQHGVSYGWFRKAFKEVIGTSPGQYHLNLKIEKACQLLRETPLSVSEIAYKTGFESEFYFSRIFKKKMTVPPSSYREG
jgi:AraC-like DNA-binding protein